MLGSVSSSMTSCHAVSFTAGCGRAAAARAALRLPAAVGSRSASASMNGVASPVVVDVARGRQRGDDAPPQVGVDGQPGQPVLGRVGVQQRGQHGDVPQRQHRGAQRVDVGQLVVRSRLGGAGQLQQPVGEQRPALRSRPSPDRRTSAARSAPAAAAAAPRRPRSRRPRPPRPARRSRGPSARPHASSPTPPTRPACGGAVRRCRRCASAPSAATPGPAAASSRSGRRR